MQRSFVYRRICNVWKVIKRNNSFDWFNVKRWKRLFSNAFLLSEVYILFRQIDKHQRRIFTIIKQPTSTSWFIRLPSPNLPDWQYLYYPTDSPTLTRLTKVLLSAYFTLCHPPDFWRTLHKALSHIHYYAIIYMG